MEVILIIEDEQKIRNLLRLYLEKAEYSILEAATGREGLEKITQTNVDLVLLDVMLPEIDGWTICRKVKRERDIPVIMLTARSEEHDKLFGFELGVDDYVVKPFSPKEVVARVKAVLKRVNRENGLKKQSKQIINGQLIIDLEAQEISLGKSILKLTPKEYNLMLLFANNPDRVFSREMILNQVWGYDYYGDLRTVDTHVKQLREKLADEKKRIVTIWGRGYKYESKSL